MQIKRNKSRNAVLPHLPKAEAMPNIQISNTPMMPGKKTLPPTDWKNDQENAVVPAKQGVPWTDRQSKIQFDSELEPPPMFTATPSRTMTLRRTGQNHAYRMNSGIDPVVLLTSRLETWRLALKNLVALFKKMIVVENKTFKGLIGASKVIELPFRQSNGQFLESGGIQDVWGSMRDYTVQHAMLHHENSSYLERAVIPALRAIKADTKTLIQTIQKDKELKSTSIYRSRMELDRMIRDLDHAIQHVQRSPHQADQTTDPFLLNLCVIHAVRELCDYENQLHDNILSLQKETGVFEVKIIENVRYILQKYEEYRVKHKMEHQDFIGHVNEIFRRVKPNTEWDEFVRRHQYHLVMENAAYKTESSVEYPNQDSKYVRAIKIGPLELKSGVMRSWTEGVYILTPAGFLHGYKTPKHFQQNPLHPSYSIFIPQTSVENSDEDELCLELYSEKKRSLGGGHHYIFRASNPREAREWLDALVHISNQFRVVPLLEYDQGAGFSSTSRQRDLPPLPPSTLPRPPHAAIEGSSQGAQGPSQGFSARTPDAQGQTTLNPVQEEQEHHEDAVDSSKQEVPQSSQDARQRQRSDEDDPRLEGEEDDHSFILAQDHHQQRSDQYAPVVNTQVS
ncbi:hypothetical protein G6F64_011615 [Rhizopus arrhizus]|uniref:PH domain-containing protein n=1 Tax=Rhizopus oryzae TaxID=64495 RepID=A0A9P7BLM3_RHIOR|nr:hypothetical protein G6F64_011615 [Rhizopus arrhizus]